MYRSIETPDGERAADPLSEPLSWTRVETPPILGPDALHLWRIRTGDDGEPLGACLGRLVESQRRRAAEMSYAPARDRWVRSHAGLRAVLALYLGVEPQTIAFRRGPAGKPYLGGRWEGCGLEFNLSNSGDLALVAVGLRAELGIDCERIRPRVALEGIARRMLAPETVATIAAAPETERLPLFYRAWTALEADAKCDGRGLFRSRAPGALPPRVVNLIPEPGYVAAVARHALPPVHRWCAFEAPPIGRRADHPPSLSPMIAAS